MRSFINVAEFILREMRPPFLLVHRVAFLFCLLKFLTIEPLHFIVFFSQDLFFLLPYHLFFRLKGQRGVILLDSLAPDPPPIFLVDFLDRETHIPPRGREPFSFPSGSVPLMSSSALMVPPPYGTPEAGPLPSKLGLQQSRLVEILSTSPLFSVEYGERFPSRSCRQ